MVEHAYIVDFASVVLVCLGVRDTGEAGEKPLRNRDERVASDRYHNLALTHGYTEAAEVLHGGEIGCLDVFYENPLPYSGLVGDGKSFLESILFFLEVVPADVPLQYRPFQGTENSPLHHIVTQRCILIFLGLVLVLIAVSTAVFFPVCPPLVAVRCSATF
jgi:hypothetical protein